MTHGLIIWTHADSYGCRGLVEGKLDVDVVSLKVCITAICPYAKQLKKTSPIEHGYRVGFRFFGSGRPRAFLGDQFFFPLGSEEAWKSSSSSFFLLEEAR